MHIPAYVWYPPIFVIIGLVLDWNRYARHNARQKKSGDALWRIILFGMVWNYAWGWIMWLIVFKLLDN